MGSGIRKSVWLSVLGGVAVVLVWALWASQVQRDAASATADAESPGEWTGTRDGEVFSSGTVSGREAPQAGRDTRVPSVVFPPAAAPSSEPQRSVVQIATLQETLQDVVPAGVFADPSEHSAAAAGDPSRQADGRRSDHQPDEPTQAAEGDLSISGRVLTESGDPVGGIEVFVRDFRRGSEKRTVSAETGFYQITGLPPGEYQIQNRPTGRFRAAVIHARAGLKSADLILPSVNTLVVSGTVTDAAGAPLAGVEVMAKRVLQVRSNAAGYYRFTLERRRDHSERLTFRWRDQEQVVYIPGSVRESQYNLDVRFDNDTATVVVRGVVRNEFGEPLENARVRLYSVALAANFTGVSDRYGRFVIEAVRIADDYQLIVEAQGSYQRYTRPSLAVRPGLLPLEVVVSSLATGTVAGTITDVMGNPLPGYTLTLRSLRAPANLYRVIADAFGGFQVANVPEGELRFSTSSQPHIRIEGFNPGSVMDLRLIVDWGDYTVSGVVVDRLGNPLAGVRVVMTWRHTADGLKSFSSRYALSDDNGAFRFTEVGPGLHEIVVNMDEYQPFKTSYAVGSEFSVVQVPLMPR